MWRIAGVVGRLYADMATVLPGWCEVICRDLTLVFCCLLGLLFSWWGWGMDPLMNKPQ